MSVFLYFLYVYIYSSSSFPFSFLPPVHLLTSFVLFGLACPAAQHHHHHHHHRQWLRRNARHIIPLYKAFLKAASRLYTSSSQSRLATTATLATAAPPTTPGVINLSDKFHPDSLLPPTSLFRYTYIRFFFSLIYFFRLYNSISIGLLAGHSLLHTHRGLNLYRTEQNNIKESKSQMSLAFEYKRKRFVFSSHEGIGFCLELFFSSLSHMFINKFSVVNRCKRNSGSH